MSADGKALSMTRRSAVSAGRCCAGFNAVSRGDSGPADTSLEDCAVAMVDEAETAKHRRQRFMVAN
ncbi:hypothetical protein [Piscinibacter sp.]|uniref:hypothetical protein n=1 Tax=Piscinibacter sp. TaxID=1903157 RepID=UPI002B89D158|nr:hypothetical protein [Albitalea sp.]HUG26060.1 hypothetical protein [Albitalea sp.]